jgi:hypothetical protein
MRSARNQLQRVEAGWHALVNEISHRLRLDATEKILLPRGAPYWRANWRVPVALLVLLALGGAIGFGLLRLRPLPSPTMSALSLDPGPLPSPSSIPNPTPQPARKKTGKTAPPPSQSKIVKRPAVKRPIAGIGAQRGKRNQTSKPNSVSNPSLRYMSLGESSARVKR